MLFTFTSIPWWGELECDFQSFDYRSLAKIKWRGVLLTVMRLLDNIDVVPDTDCKVAQVHIVVQAMHRPLDSKIKMSPSEISLIEVK
jgi:hypothetical protein